MMALGTGSVGAVDMVVGPGNAYVARRSASSTAASASTCSPARPRR
jgi:histidinol dehydrogenase